MGLTAEQILQADDLKREEVEVPEWGGTVWVRTMTGHQRDEFEMYLQAAKGPDEKFNQRRFRATLLTRTLCNEQGQALFSEDEVDALGQKSAKALDRLLPVAMRLNGLSQADQEALEKN